MRLRARRLATRLATLLVLAVAVPSSASAQAPYEPNDSLAQAFGPLAGATSYSGYFETDNDVDWFYWYSSRSAQFDISFVGASCGGYYATLKSADGADVHRRGPYPNEVDHFRLTLGGPARYFLLLERWGGIPFNCPYQFRIDPADAVTSTPPTPGPQPAPSPQPPISQPSEECIEARASLRRVRKAIARDKRLLRHAHSAKSRARVRRRLRAERRFEVRARSLVRRVC